jgi:hypothetical protein
MRKFVFKSLKDGYDIRSKIIHGAKYKPDALRSLEHVVMLLARQVLKNLISDPAQHSRFSGDTECDEYLRLLPLGGDEGPTGP